MAVASQHGALAAEPLWPPQAVRSAATGRIDAFDNLRALAMLLGVALHAGMAYADPAQTFWLAMDPGSSVLVNGAISLIHLFRMSLFYLLSGYFAALLVQRRGVAGFLGNRALRVAAPLVLFYPVLLVAMALVVAFGLSWVNEPRGLLALIAKATQQVDGQSTAQLPGTMHLWFLYYLVLFTLITAAVARIRWDWFGWLARRPGLLLVVGPLAVFPGVLGAGVPLPPPESLIPTWWPFATYGVMYAGGWQLFGREEVLAALARWKGSLLLVCGVLFPVYSGLVPAFDLDAVVSRAVEWTAWRYCLAAGLTALLSVYLSLVLILVCREWMARPNLFLRFIADASYWIYLIHLPVVIFLQMILVPVPCNLWIKLLITGAGTFLFCMATYLVFVRYTPLGWLLNGKRSFP